MSHYIFKDPIWFFAAFAIPLIIWLRGRRSVTVLVVPFSAAWHRPSLANASRLPAALATLGFVLILAALARPQRVEDKKEVRSEGYDLMLAIDLSGSMLTEDFERNGQVLNRLQVVKPVVQAFINDRPNDRIGLVVFSGRAYTLAPLTFDHAWLSRQVDRLKLGLIEDGTAIGDGLGVALTRLEQAERVDKGRRVGAFVVLLTDGANNRGSLTPVQATEIAKARGLPVYTIGAGREGIVRVPVFDNNGNRITTMPRQSDLDERTLRYIASETGGRYFRANDVDTIENAFKSIDEARKIEFQAKSYLVTTELFTWLAISGASAFLLGAGIASIKRIRRSTSPSIRAASPARTQTKTSVTQPASAAAS